MGGQGMSGGKGDVPEPQSLKAKMPEMGMGPRAHQGYFTWYHSPTVPGTKSKLFPQLTRPNVA